MNKFESYKAEVEAIRRARLKLCEAERRNEEEEVKKNSNNRKEK